MLVLPFGSYLFFVFKIDSIDFIVYNLYGLVCGVRKKKKNNDKIVAAHRQNKNALKNL